MSISVELILLTFWSAVVSIRKSPNFPSHRVSMEGPSDCSEKKQQSFQNHVLLRCNAWCCLPPCCDASYMSVTPDEKHKIGSPLTVSPLVLSPILTLHLVGSRCSIKTLTMHKWTNELLHIMESSLALVISLYSLWVPQYWFFTEGAQTSVCS